MTGNGGGRLRRCVPGADAVAFGGDALKLRRLAEEKMLTEPHRPLEELSPGEVRRLAHELQVYQVELEMQNEELRRAVAELDFARARYFDLYEFAPVGYITLDHQGCIQEANLRISILLGELRSGLIGQPLSRFVHPEDQDCYYYFHKRLKAIGTVESTELRLLSEGDGPIWVRVEAAIEKDDQQGQFASRVTVSDITEIKTAAEALRQSEEKYRTIADFTYDWEYWLAPDQHFLYCSAACERITGYRAEEFLCDPGLLLSIVHPEDRTLLERHLRQGPDHETNPADMPSQLEFRVMTRSGEVRWIGHACCTVRGRDGSYLGRRGCNRDITERKASEAERKKLQDDLHQSQKIESIGRLAGGVAHDFNNMLSVIIGYGEMIQGNLGPEHPEHDNLSLMLNAAHRSAELTRQLLAFARKQQISPKVLDLNDFIPNMLKLLRRLIGEDIELTFSPGPDSPPVFMDPSQVDQLLANLCVNARDAMPTSGGRIAIETRSQVLDLDTCARFAGCQPGKYVLLQVRDTGCGMEPELLRNIFEPFFTTKGLGRGTGMGLATVYGIVRQNNGGIGVESAPGEGSCFRIYLPAATEMVGIGQKDSQRSVPPRGHGELILVVEDQQEVSDMTSCLLEKLGYMVLTANDPLEALRLVMTRSREIDLLLTDIIMPHMNGRELANRVLALAPGLKTLFMSGYAGDSIKGLVDQSDAGHFIAKPFTMREMAEKVRRILDGDAE